MSGLVRVVLHDQRCSSDISSSIDRASVEWLQVLRRPDDLGADAGCSRGSCARNRGRERGREQYSRTTPEQDRDAVRRLHPVLMPDPAWVGYEHSKL